MTTFRKPSVTIEDFAISTELNYGELQKLKENIEDYLKATKLKSNPCLKLIQHLEITKQDDKLLLDYIQCKKHKVDDAWQTLKSYVECRFIHYPNVFLNEQDKLPEKLRYLVRNHIYGGLKNRDKFGRLIAFFDVSKWDTHELSVDELTFGSVIGCESFWRHPDIKEKGLVLVANASGYSKSHARKFNLQKMIRMRDLNKSFPVSCAGIFCVQTSYVFSLVMSVLKPLLPKKMRSRMMFYSSNQTPTELHDIASPDILPDWLGGKLTIEEAAEDESFHEKYWLQKYNSN